jgi:hypothetical protein
MNNCKKLMSELQRDYVAEFLSGYSAALSDYRTLLASEYRSKQIKEECLWQKNS